MILVASGGVLAGVFAFPMKSIQSWNWENIWFAYSCFGFLLIPFIIVNASVPNLSLAYHGVSTSCLIVTVASGYAWGWGSALFGVGIQRLGMGVGFSLILGITTIFGTLAPLTLTGAENVHFIWLIPGLILLAFGLLFCGRAGALRSQSGETASSSGSYLTGLVLCILSGCFSAAFNLGATAGRPIQDAAASQGTPNWAAASAFWPILLLGGFLGSGTYCCILFVKNHSFSKFWSTGIAEWGHTFAMGLIWISGVLLYGLGSFRMGSLGTVLGWPIFTALMVVSAYFFGMLTGEWRGATLRSLIWMNSGILIIAAALFLVARG